MRQGGRMESCRGPWVPLIVVALALTAGCVTVRPDAPGTGPGTRLVPTGVRTALPAQPTVEARPLGRLPETAPAPASPAAPDASLAPDAGVPVSVPGAAERDGERDGAESGAARRRQAGPDRPERPRRAKPGRPAAAPGAAPAAKPRKPRPAPNRSYDMAPLCAAARGTVDPAIVALCH